LRAAQDGDIEQAEQHLAQRAGMGGDGGQTVGQALLDLDVITVGQRLGQQQGRGDQRLDFDIFRAGGAAQVGQLVRFAAFFGFGFFRLLDGRFEGALAQAVFFPQLGGQDIGGRVLLAAQVAHAHAQLAGDFFLAKLLDVAVGQQVIDQLCLGRIGCAHRRLELLDRLAQDALQRGDRVGLVLQFKDPDQRAAPQIIRIIQVPERASQSFEEQFVCRHVRIMSCLWPLRGPKSA